MSQNTLASHISHLTEGDPGSHASVFQFFSILRRADRDARWMIDEMIPAGDRYHNIRSRHCSQRKYAREKLENGQGLTTLTVS